MERFGYNPSIKLYFGLGLYKAGSDVDGGTWQKSDTIIADQIQAGREAQGVVLCFIPMII